MAIAHVPHLDAQDFWENLHSEAAKALDQATHLSEEARMVARSELNALRLRLTLDSARWALYEWTVAEKEALSRDLTESLVNAGVLASQEIARRVTDRVAHEYWEEYQESLLRSNAVVSWDETTPASRTSRRTYETLSLSSEVAVHDTGIELRLSIRENASVAVAQELFDLYGGVYDALVVTTEAGLVVGILRQTDLPAHGHADSVAELFTPAFPTVTRSTPYTQALELMKAHSVCVLPVVNEQGRLVGYVTKALAEIAQTEGTTRTELTRLELYMARVG